MNYYDYDILKTLKNGKYVNQHILSEETGYSIGIVNKSIRSMVENGYLSESIQCTSKTIQRLKETSPQNAIILAAGYGMRMVPVNFEMPKAFIAVKGEKLIERQIRQLHDAGIYNIYIVVGFMKETFEYLIDEYDVNLIVNTEYSLKNNLHSLYLAREFLNNSYIVPCDLWFENNPFNKDEFYSWYMVSDAVDIDSDVRVNRKKEIVKVTNNQNGNRAIGLSYISSYDAQEIIDKLDTLEKKREYRAAFWEEALYNGDKMTVLAKTVADDSVQEINTYEQLRAFDENSEQLQNKAIEYIAASLDVSENSIKDILVLKKGMTNRSFLFTCENQKYIMRIPGEGTSQLINRQNEAMVYRKLDKSICDDVIAIDSENGYKITRYYENARTCDAKDKTDVAKCMRLLRKFHEEKHLVDNCFDIFERMEFYESLWGENDSIYKDYSQTKNNIYKLKKYVEKYKKPYVLSHIDSVPDNFLIFNLNGNEEVRLIDWEYAGMCDPDVDIAMFSIYALYSKEEIDDLINLYYVEGCANEVRIKIYCYIAVCGLLWSNWCEYKHHLGVEFGEYALRQYRYAKEFFRIVNKELEGNI